MQYGQYLKLTPCQDKPDCQYTLKLNEMILNLLKLSSFPHLTPQT